MGGLVFGWSPNKVRYGGFEVAGGCDLAMHRGGLVGAKKKSKNQAIGARFWLEKCGWVGFWVKGTLMG